MVLEVWGCDQLLLLLLGYNGVEYHTAGACGDTELPTLSHSENREKKKNMCVPTVFFLWILFYPGFHPVRWSLSATKRQVFLSQLMAHMPIISGNIPTDTPRSMPY